MSINYQKTVWKAGREGGTAFTPERLNNIENGIEAVTDGLNAVTENSIQNLITNSSVEVGWAYKVYNDVCATGDYSVYAKYTLKSLTDSNSYVVYGFAVHVSDDGNTWTNLIDLKREWDTKSLGTIREFSGNFTISDNKYIKVYLYGAGNDSVGKLGTATIDITFARTSIPIYSYIPSSFVSRVDYNANLLTIPKTVYGGYVPTEIYTLNTGREIKEVERWIVFIEHYDTGNVINAEEYFINTNHLTDCKCTRIGGNVDHSSYLSSVVCDGNNIVFSFSTKQYIAVSAICLFRS